MQINRVVYVGLGRSCLWLAMLTSDSNLFKYTQIAYICWRCQGCTAAYSPRAAPPPRSAPVRRHPFEGDSASWWRKKSIMGSREVGFFASDSTAQSLNHIHTTKMLVLLLVGCLLVAAEGIPSLVLGWRVGKTTGLPLLIPALSMRASGYEFPIASGSRS